MEVRRRVKLYSFDKSLLMNRSGHKHDSTNKKQPKPLQAARSIKHKQQGKSDNRQSRSKSRQHKQHKKQSSHKLKSPQSKHQQYFKLSVYQQFPSKQSSSLKANLSNDYCVNEYFAKSTKLKPEKKQPKTFYQTQNYFNNPDFRTVQSQIQPYTQQYGFDAHPIEKNLQHTQQTQHLNNKISTMMKKISFSDKRALINCDGKIVSSSKEKTKKSLLNKSNSQNTLSFSKQYLSKNQTKNKSKSKNKIKSKSKQHKLKLKEKEKEKQRQHKEKDLSRQHKPGDKLLKAKSGDKHVKKQYIVIKQNYQPNKQADKLYQTKYPREQKHSYTESSQTLSREQSKEQFYYYQRYPTSSTTIADNSSSQSSSSSSSNLKNNKPQMHTSINFTQLSAQISSQIAVNSMTLRKQKQLKYKGNFHLQRLKCLNLIASVCGQLRTKRQTFSLAIYYFDKYILNFQCLNTKCIALTCIMIALKMDIPQLLPKYCFAFRPNPEATIKKSNKSHKKKKSQHTSSSSSLIKQKDSFLDTKDKLSLLMTLPIYTSKDLYQQEKQEDFHIGEIIQMEIEVMARLKFRFYCKTHVYWVDLLTSAWDGWMVERQANSDSSKPVEQNENSKVFFKRSLQSQKIKSHKDFKLFSYLNQTIQCILTLPQSYKYNPITITLSIMYLLIRLQLQQRKSLQPLTIYKYYRQNLTKSCNLIFCDSVGANLLFGNFLSKLSLNMAIIVDAVQFVSRFIVPEDFKIWNYRELFGENYVDQLSNFVYNPAIFRVKSTN